MTEEKKPGKFASWIDRTKTRALTLWNYYSEGVWEDNRDTAKVNIVKTLNLTVRSFMSSDLQSAACALTYRTLLAIVPALALLFAIGRGFGFQNLLQSQLYQYFPSQHKALEMAFSFVDSCLAQASEGIFVGVGIVFLLWTLISLLDSVETSFNNIWGVTVDRPFARKVTDYLAICIILPVLMICSGGLRIFMSTTIQKLLPFDFIGPVVGDILDLVSILFGCLFFAGAYALIPNTKVKLKNALITGGIAGIAFQILQWLFVSGQIYVSKYNAIYGSFSFLPLMLIWMQFSWLITLAGALICHSSQDIFLFSFERQTNNISGAYRRKVCLAVLTVIIKRFKDEEPPLNIAMLSSRFAIPPRLTGIVVNFLLDCKLIVKIMGKDETEPDFDAPLIPATSPDHYSLGHVLEVLSNHGESSFLPTFDAEFKPLLDLCDKLDIDFRRQASSVLLGEINLPLVKD
ncbi:YihY/virulence factor BrkB family protein [uncultured Duncaniella sp.]|uniref:YihY/virulence factor BrkB family protein n=1 Tax=uncultured Duncaniella sp. TaxID=2768039 RepID=UPI0025E57E7C|nr:YihY/virulence factor BrkB family protein [uncultured Duncaniella sp.]